jgi:hypothetical protein
MGPVLRADRSFPRLTYQQCGLHQRRLRTQCLSEGEGGGQLYRAFGANGARTDQCGDMASARACTVGKVPTGRTELLT